MMSDETDAKGFFASFFQPSSEVIGSKIQTCSKYDDFYNLTHENRGVALIFNHNVFDDPKNKKREGTDLDRNRLITVLTELEFEVRVYEDLTFGELYAELKKVSQENHTHNDCILVCVMSHGDEGVIYAKDLSYSPNILWKFFVGDQCPTLVGKPKMFFIQACRGSLVDDGVKLRDVQADSNVYQEPEETYTIPIMADILIMNATYAGYYSWRSPSKGSWFIQSLCDILEEYGNTQTLLNMLTLVNRRVAIDFKSNVPDDRSMDKKRQICTIVSMLTRFVAFPVKRPKKRYLAVCPPGP